MLGKQMVRQVVALQAEAKMYISITKPNKRRINEQAEIEENDQNMEVEENPAGVWWKNKAHIITTGTKSG